MMNGTRTRDRRRECPGSIDHVRVSPVTARDRASLPPAIPLLAEFP